MFAQKNKKGIFMKKFITVFLLSLLFSTNIFADLIDGPANIRETPNGKILFSLNNDVSVQCEDIADNWCHISLMVWVKPEDVLNKKQIKKDAILYDSDNHEIGKHQI